MNMDIIEEATKRLVDDGKIIEAGWRSLQALAFPAGMSKEQEADLRATFFAGAQHLYASILTMLEPGVEATEKDLSRMVIIDRELRAFVEEFKTKNGLI